MKSPPTMIVSKKKHLLLRANPFIYILIFFCFYAIFLIVLLAFLPQPSRADTSLINNGFDTCGLIKVSLAQTPNCNVLSSFNGNSGSCKNPTNGAKNANIGDQTLQITLKSNNGALHQVTYNTANNFCTNGYLNTSGNFCNCVSNPLYTNQTVVVPATGSVPITITRSPTTGSNCGSYQFDFSIQSIDGNTNCTMGNGSSAVGASLTCETGTTCGAAPTPTPTPPPNCTTTPINCSACSAPSNTCSNGNGTQTCTLSQPQTCKQVVTTRSCTLNNCTNGNLCVNQVCQPPTYTVSGNIFIDTNGDGLQNNGETAYTGGITITGSKGTVTTNAANGTYTVSNIVAGTYTISYTSLPAGYFMTYPTNAPPSFSVTVGGGCNINGARNASCNAGNIQNLKFGIHPLYTITGSIFDDLNKNGKIDNGENNYAATPAISATKGTVTVNANGTYTINNIPAGGVTVRYTTLPASYYMTSPLNGPPPSFSVTVGTAGCTVNGAPGATCAAGDIANLNFGITNTHPWVQAGCGDIRNDNGISDMLPAGQSVFNTNASCKNPGIVFTGDTKESLGQGQASQIVGGVAYPEIVATTSLDTSYTSLLAKAQGANITPTDLSSVCTLSNCTLNGATLPHGIYSATGNVTLNAFTVPANKNYIFLINGTLTVNGNIKVSPNATALFSTKGNIIISPTVGTVANDPTTTLEGWYISGQSFIVNSQGTCTDLRLNIGGSITVNALRNGGSFINNRDLCGNDTANPTVSIIQRLDMLLHAPSFIQRQQTISQEVAP